MAPERETLEIDVLFVGAGPASLAGAYRLATLVAEHNAIGGTANRSRSRSRCSRRAREIGSHALSGAVVDPRALRELFPDDWREAPLEGEVKDEKLLWLTAKRAISLPVPPPARQRGQLRRLARQAGQVDGGQGRGRRRRRLRRFPGRSVLLDGERVVGVRTGDRGLDKHGKQKSNYEPGVDIRAKVVVLGEGPRGTLTLELEQSHGLMRGKQPAGLRHRPQGGLGAAAGAARARRRRPHHGLAARPRTPSAAASSTA